jgi:hypothetical protein
VTNPLGPNPYAPRAPSGFLSNFEPEEEEKKTGLPTPGLFDYLGENPFVRGARDIAAEGINKLSYVLQPAQAPQQLLLGAAGTLQGIPGAWDRGVAAASSYLQYGSDKEAIERRLTGQELLKEAGAPEWVQRWGGLGIDVFADPVNLVGGAGIALKTVGTVSKVNAVRKVGESLVKGSKVIDRATTLGVPSMAAEVFRRTPAAFRNNLAQGAEDLLLEREFDVSGVPILGQMFKSMEGRSKTTVRELFVPDWFAQRIVSQTSADRLGELAGVRKVGERLGREFEVKLGQVTEGFKHLSRQTDRATFEQIDSFIGDMAGARTRADFERAKGRLQQLTITIGKPQVYREALAVYRRGVQFDYWAGQQLVNLGLLTEDAVRQNLAWANRDLSAGRRFAQAGAGPEYGSNYVAPKRAPVLTDWAGNEGDSRAGSLRRLFLLYGEDAEAHIARIRAQNRPASVTLDAVRLEQSIGNVLGNFANSGALPTFRAGDEAFAQAADAKQITDTLVRHFADNPSRRLADGVIAVVQEHNLDPWRVRRLIDAIDASQTGFRYQRSSAESARSLGNLREELVGGGFPTRQRVLDMQDSLDPEVLEDLGLIRSAFASWDTQSRVMGRLATRRAGYVGLRQTVEDELGSPLFHRDDPGIPAEMIDRSLSGSRWRAVTAEQARASTGVFREGEIVPAWVHRTLTVVKTGDDRVDYAGLVRASQWWKAVKLGNPASIARNIVSGVLQAEEYGISPVEMLQGFSRYLTVQLGRDRSGLDQLRNSGLGASTLTAEAKQMAATLVASASGGVSNRRGVLDTIGRFVDVSLGVSKDALEPGALKTLAMFNPATGFGFGRKAFEAFGKTEEMLKGSIFFSQLAKGKTLEEAADFAEDALFDYAARPLWADFTSRSGLDPFSTFRTLSFYRTLENLYDRPIRTARLYRVPQTVNEWHPDDAQLTMEYASMDEWLTQKMPLRVGTDSAGRGMYIPFLALLPGGAVVDVLDDANGVGIPLTGGFVAKPPLWQLFESAVLGVGFKGRETYANLGGGSLQEAMTIDGPEALRRAAKEALRLVAYPWTPGQPNLERVAKSIAQIAKNSEQIAAETGVEPEEVDQRYLRFLRDNVLMAWGEGQDSVRPDSKYGDPAQDLGFSLGRLVGLTAYDIQGNPVEPGDAQNEMIGLKYEKGDLKRRWQQRIALEPDPARREALIEEARRAFDDFEKRVRETREPYERGK